MIQLTDADIQILKLTGELYFDLEPDKPKTNLLKVIYCEERNN